MGDGWAKAEKWWMGYFVRSRGRWRRRGQEAAAEVAEKYRVHARECQWWGGGCRAPVGAQVGQDRRLCFCFEGSMVVQMGWGRGDASDGELSRHTHWAIVSSRASAELELGQLTWLVRWVTLSGGL